MGKGKPHLEFEGLNMTEGWEEPEVYPKGMQQKILTSDLDEAKKTGSRSRFLRLLPGVYSTEPFIHDHWEEVFLFELTESLMRQLKQTAKPLRNE